MEAEASDSDSKNAETKIENTEKDPIGDTGHSVEKTESSTGKGDEESKSIGTPPVTSPAAAKKEKINILLKPVGDAPILKQRLWSVDPDKPVSSILLFIKSYLRLEGDQSLFFFVNQAFAPSPDQLIRNLYECFGSDGKLILNYSTTTAWG